MTQLLQRDAGMIILKKDWIAPSLVPAVSRLEPARHQKEIALQVGEMVVMLDYPESKDWYVVKISQVLHDRFAVNGFITIETPLDSYRQASKKMRMDARKGIAFLRTWCKDKGKGIATTVPPKHLKGLEKYLWKWRLPIEESDKLLLVSNVELDPDGCLRKASRNLAAALKFPHHVGAGGEELSSRSVRVLHILSLSLLSLR
jgi:hypothetical protein